MNSKNIKAILSKKFNDFVESIENEEVRKLVKKNSIISGGCIVSMLMKEEINDFDIYFKNKETTLAVANYYVEKFREAKKPKFDDKDLLSVIDMEDRIKIFIRSVGIVGDTKVTDSTEPNEDAAMKYLLNDKAKEEEDKKELPKYRPIWLSSNAITLSDKVQLIVRFYGDADTIHSNYDFVHCASYWESGENKLVLRQEALEAILAKELKYIGSKYPLCSVIRTRKFIKRGFTINAGQYLKMVLQINRLNFLDINTLEDQLIGVDSVYFNDIIEQIKNKQESDPSFKLDETYLLTIINRIF